MNHLMILTTVKYSNRQAGSLTAGQFMMRTGVEDVI